MSLSQNYMVNYGLDECSEHPLSLNDAHGDLCDDPGGPLVVGCGINECLFVLLGGDLGHLWLLPSYFGSFSPDFSLIILLFSTGAAILVIVLV